VRVDSSTLIIAELTECLRAVAGRFEASRLGLYLHGSHARGEAGPLSDVDVLGLCTGDDDTTWMAAQQDCLDALSSQHWHDRLDLKVIDVDEFADNPWVDLRRSRWLAGFAWHETLPPRTRDQAGRESLGVLGVLFEDGCFRQRDARELWKPVGRLCSVLAGLVSGTVPQSASEALRLLGTDGRLARELRDLRDELARLPDDSIITETLSSRIQQAARDVAEVLRVQVERGALGPICTAAGTQALAKLDT
jgi:predicted nucleotidyltransferase